MSYTKECIAVVKKQLRAAKRENLAARKALQFCLPWVDTGSNADSMARAWLHRKVKR
jgi:hypothetical protein